MNVFYAALLGLLQGLTEFLPVSSSGHLVLAQKLLNVDLGGADLLFDIILHVGTLFSVCVVMHRQLFALFKRPFKKLFYLIAASVPAAAAGVFLGGLIDRVFFGGAYLCGAFLITAASLTAAQIYAKKRQSALPLKFRHAACMGVAQAIAVIPGISRSGATVAAGILCGADREEVAEFSFLLSIPVIAGGFVVNLYKAFADGVPLVSVPDFGMCAAVGIAVSAAAGLLSVKIMIKSISSARYTPFIVYLCLLSIVCGALSFAGIL